ncbi:MAG: hypothetical protein ACJ0Q8_00005 [Candidatus Azotimanducaceae bacterium]
MTPVKSAKKLKQFLADYVIYTRWKDNDKYPSLIYNNIAYQKFAQRSGLSWLRIFFWNWTCRVLPTFKGFYLNGMNTTADPRLDELFKTGFILKEEFLPSSICDKYNPIFEATINNYLSSNEFLESTAKQMRVALDFGKLNLKEFEEEVTQLVNSYTKNVYGKDIRPSFRYELEVSKDGSDELSALAKWHIDRPCPSLKALYFPLGVSAAPFSYVKGSHLYSSDWLEASRFFRDIKNYEKSGAKNVMLRKSVFYPLSSENQQNIVELNHLKSNTFYLGAHQGLHRKKPFNKPGHRFMISIEMTHDFSKVDLMLGAMSSLFKKRRYQITAP